MTEKRTTGPRVIGRSSGPRITAAQPTTPPTQVQLGHDRMLTGAREVDLSQLRPDPAQPRRSMNPERLAELAASIVSYGLLQPLVVRQDGLGRDGDMRYTVIAGGRRYAALQLALTHATGEEARRRLTRVAVVVTDTPAAQERVIQLIENLQREDLSPVEEARAFKEIMQLHALSMESLAATIHRSQGYIDERLRLLRHEEVEAAVEAGIVTKSAGAAIASIHSADLRHEWLERAKQGDTIRPRDVYASKPERRPRRGSEAAQSGDADAAGAHAPTAADGDERHTPNSYTPISGSAAPASPSAPAPPLSASAPDSSPPGGHAASAPGSAMESTIVTPAARADEALASALQLLDLPTAQALRERWRGADPPARASLLRTLLRAATPAEEALLARALAVGAQLDLSCAGLLSLLEPM